VLHKALQKALTLGFIRSNPSSACTLPRIEKAAIKPLDAPEIKSFLAALDESDYSTLLKVDLFTGMREGEILGLEWSCIDFERGTITVSKQLSRPRRKGDIYRLTSLKNDKPRTINPAPFVMGLLKEHRRKQLEKRLLAGPLWEEGDFPDLVFTNDFGKHLCYNVVLRHFRKALAVAGIPSKRFHDLRHTYAVSSLRAGDDVKTVQENLGHHTAAFTLDQYGHVTETMREASARRMEAFIDTLK
jgi:integrase